jgi:hypothetical protein
MLPLLPLLPLPLLTLLTLTMPLMLGRSPDIQQ